MAELTIENLDKHFGAIRAVDDINLTVADGEFVTLLGPSGCGKSTTLGAIAGLEQPTGGRITVGKTVYFDGARGIFLAPEARNCGLVFQSYALWPHMTVHDNVVFPLTLRQVSRSERKRRVEEALALVEMERFQARYPHELSGGQQQRVALARTLVYRPEILLLDEPLSNLDAKLRDRARTWLAELRTRLGLTTIYVTHDQVEALALSDRIVVMNGGRIAQIGTPQEIYQKPADGFVADFIGTTNFLAGEVAEAPGAGGETTVTLPGGQRIAIATERRPVKGDKVTLAFRPEQMRVVPEGPAEPGGSVIRARVTSHAYVGGRWQIGLDLGGSPLRIETSEATSAAELSLWLPVAGGILFPGQTHAKSL
ncbi:ABC transporter ATP-binding protein [Phreatobacter stygius]|uniref:ABC transporter ATP-binding protein n=1 Tax=Phreatobacter stygius TaxID=1940610 RepID=A0A4D7B9R5_9HYPH|nr:ABC transporter ATP-binding protein [Phreatobacter stygius]QCI66908.1 ABC transporter ATP-binding protein [Phreatobacter stygius]